MPTGATDLGFDVVAQQPRTELNYRVFVDTSGTEASLASIHAEQQQGGGGRLAFSTDSADGPLAQRMLIDHGGNVGIGTENPAAKLDVAGDANFNGTLKVQGTLTASGLAINGFAEVHGDLTIAAALITSSFVSNGAGKFNGPLDVDGPLNVTGAGKIAGDLSVVGKLTAASLAGDGTGLSNVTPAANSVTNARLAQDPASLSKMTGGQMVISNGNVGIGIASSPQNRLHVGPGTSSIFPSRVNAVVASNTPDAGIAIAQNSGVNVLLQASGAGGYIGTTSNHPLVFRTNDLDRMVVDTNGNLRVTGEVAGIVGIGKSWVGVYGETQGPRNAGPAGVWGDGKQSGDGVKGLTSAPNAAGVAAFHLTNQGPAIFAQGSPAGFFNGDVTIQGRLRASVKSFVIDHPLDPANKFLAHASVESPDLMNIYNGNIITDKEGNATVLLPDYFEALNRDFRYQLTVIGKFAQAAVAEEIKDNCFSVKTDQPNVKVSWQVTGIRHDVSANAHRLTVEEEKPENQRGLFLHPEHYGQPNSKGIAFVHSLESREANFRPSKLEE